MKDPTKTFGLQTPRELHAKLLYDIERLKAKRFSNDVSYAAFDCAVTAWHIADWLLHALTDDHARNLCGGKKPDVGAFVDHNKDRLPLLPYCREIANSVKHFVITRGSEMPHVSTDIIVMFEPPFDPAAPERQSETNIRAIGVIDVGDQRHPVVNLFESMAQHWDVFLNQEGQYRAEGEN